MAPGWFVFRDPQYGFVLRTMPDERVHASGSLEACRAAGLLLSGSRVGLASSSDEAAMDVRLWTDREVFGEALPASGRR